MNIICKSMLINTYHIIYTYIIGQKFGITTIF